jgi:hypothetical protein
MTEIKREIPSQRDGIPKAYDSSNLPDDKAGTEDKWYKYWLDNKPSIIN